MRKEKEGKKEGIVKTSFIGQSKTNDEEHIRDSKRVKGPSSVSFTVFCALLDDPSPLFGLYTRTVSLCVYQANMYILPLHFKLDSSGSISN
jgi:hypothetical protein